jgi:hypothetical protein
VINSPSITLVPPSCTPNQAIAVIVNGTGTHFNPGTTIEVSSGITGEMVSTPLTTKHASIELYAGVVGVKTVTMRTAIPGAGGESVQGTFSVISGGGGTPPIFNNVRFNGRPYYQGNVVSATPIITSVITADVSDPLREDYCTMEVDGVPVVTSYTFTMMPGADPNARLLTINVRTPLQAQPVGLHFIRIGIMSNLGAVATWEGTVVVMSGAVQMVGPAYNYRNPFKPLSGDPDWNTTKIMYNLNVEATITIIIYDLTGQEVYRNTFGGGSEGGRAGINQVEWNGRSIFGDVVGNGMYLYKIISGNKVIGSGKLVVLD